MKVHGYLPWSVALFLALLGFAVDARDLDQDEALQLRQQGVILPFEQLIDQAMKLYPAAKLLDVELEEKNSAYVYEVELLTAQGVVRELKFDARDGRLLKDKEDH